MALKYSIRQFFITVFILLYCISTPLLAQEGHAQEGHDTKLIAGYTAKPLKVGQGYIHTIDGVIYEGEVGITPFLSIGIGMGFPLEKFGSTILGVKAKIAFPIGKNVHLGVGTYLFHNSGDTDNMSTGIVTINLGGIQATLGTGFTSRYNAVRSSDKTLFPLITFGVIIPIFKNGYLVNENWEIFADDKYYGSRNTTTSSFVLRWNYKRLSSELGLLIGKYEGDDGTYGGVVPQVGISFHF